MNVTEPPLSVAERKNKGNKEEGVGEWDGVEEYHRSWWVYLPHRLVGGEHHRLVLEEGGHLVLELVGEVRCVVREEGGVRLGDWMKRGKDRIAIVSSWLDRGVGNRR
jgi:hypothetical protein